MDSHTQSRGWWCGARIMKFVTVLCIVGSASSRSALSHGVPSFSQPTSETVPNDHLVQRDLDSAPASEKAPVPRSPQGALIMAAARGDLEGVKRAIELGADVNGQSLAGHTALIVAAAQGQTATVQYLLTRGADVNIPGVKGSTALIAAARRWHEEIVQLLLDHGADVHARTHFQVTALLAALSGEGFMYDATLNVYEAKQFAITHEAIPQVRRLLILLLDHGADVNARNMKGATPLRLAVETGHSELVQTLLQYGAQVHGKAKDGQTVLMAAQARNLPEIENLLQQAGARH